MHLETFVEDQQVTLEQFKAWWLRRNAEDSITFPLEIGEDNEGIWWEQFDAFASMSYMERMS